MDNSYLIKKIIRVNSCSSWIILLFVFTSFSFSFTFSIAQNSTFDSLANEIYRISFYKKTESLEKLDSLFQISYNSPDSSLLIARCLLEKSSIHYLQKIEDSMLINEIKDRLARENLLFQEHAFLQYALSTNLMFKGEFGEAFTMQLQVLEKFKKLNLNRFVVRTLNNLGNICYYIGLYNLSDYYYFEAISNTTPEFHEYFILKQNIYKNELLINKNEAVIDSILFLLEEAEKTGNEVFYISTYNTLGAGLLSTYPDKGFYFLSKAETLDYDNQNVKSSIYCNLGVYYFINNDLSKSLNYFRKAQKIMEEINDVKNLAIIYENISELYENQNILDSALFYARKNKEFIQKLQSNTIAIETHQKYITSMLEASQKDLVIAKQKNELKNRQIAIIIIVSGSIVLLFLIFLLYINQQKQRKASENRELTAKIKHERELLDAKTREITSHSLLVASKNHILQQIKELSAQIIKNKEKAVSTSQKITEIIQNNLNNDNEWDNFKMHFDMVHPQYFEKLKKLCSSFTEENLKMCAYFKMGMTTKQIAQILNITDKSVLTARWRLKIKLNLSEKDDLDYFLGNL